MARLLHTVAFVSLGCLPIVAASAQQLERVPLPAEQGPVLASPPGKSQTEVTKHAPAAPSARVLGVPVTADAPVSPSYQGTAYKTLGGQAETGQDAIADQVMQPTQSAAPH